MPRLQLTDDEAKFILEVRQRTAVDQNWNAALELAKTIVDAELSKRMPWAQVIDAHAKVGTESVSVAGTITAVMEQLDKQRREIKLG